MKRTSSIVVAIFCLFAFLTVFPRPVDASTLLIGHTYLTKDGLKKYLKNVELRWTITADTDNKACPNVDGWYRSLMSGYKFSYSFLADGSIVNPPTTPAPPQPPTPTPKRFPAARVNCLKEFDIPSPAITKYLGAKPNYTCTETDGITHDPGNVQNINYVFQRTDCFGCRSQKATLKVNGPPPIPELPAGVTQQGHWEFRDNLETPLCGTDENSECVVKHDDQGNAFLEFNDIANNDKFTGVDFEWISDEGPTATPTPTSPQCGAPCTTPGPNSPQCPVECPICNSGTNGNTCVAPTATPTPTAPTATPTPTPTLVQCGGPCTSDSQCVIACPICYVGANGGTCQAPTATPTITPTATPVPPSATPTPFCECDGLDVTANPNFTTGSPLTVIGYGKISDPATNNAFVEHMSYSLQKPAGTEVANSGWVPATPATPTGTSLRYSSSWTTTIPGPGKYHLVETIGCKAPRAVAQNPMASMSRNTGTAVLQSSTGSRGGIFGFFSALFGGLFGSGNQVRNQSAPPPTITPTPTIFDPESADSLKLGTFDPLDPHLTLGCTWAEFEVVQ